MKHELSSTILTSMGLEGSIDHSDARPWREIRKQDGSGHSEVSSSVTGDQSESTGLHKVGIRTAKSGLTARETVAVLRSLVDQIFPNAK